MSYSLSDDNDYPRMTRAVQWLIGINVAVLFLEWTVLPEGTRAFLGFQNSDFPLGAWSIVTYMFAHGGLWHLLVNMYMLWVFGVRLEHAWGSSVFVRYYLWCGVGGLIGHLLLGQGGILIGASAAVMGVMLGYAVSWPEDEFAIFGIIPMKVKWLVPLFVAINLFAGLVTLGSQGGGTAYFAHLGGIAFGWIFIRMPRTGNLDRIRRRVAQVPDETDEPPRAVPRSLPRNRERMTEIDEIVARSNAMAARRQHATVPPRKAAAAEAEVAAEGAREQLDLVLDKISERGIDSLTTAERKLLEELSRQMRGQGSEEA